jgi:hypothetical protein
MGSPAFLGYPRHFNDERTSGNDFFKAMLHDDSADKSTGWSRNRSDGEQRRFYVTRDRKQAKRSTKAGVDRGAAMIRSESDEKKISLSLAQQEIHHSSTGFPHAWETVLRSSTLGLTDCVRPITLNSLHAR